tara:strand:+ start:836 stop:2059 length:1224 start_codon:yes stop_codon:yes gene_type:complete
MLTNDIVEVDVILNNKNLPTIKILHDPIITLKQYQNNKDIINLLKISEIKENLKFYKKKMLNNIIKKLSKVRIHSRPCYTTNDRYDLKSMKSAMRSVHDLGLVGNKKILKTRLIQYFEQELCSTMIQKQIRKHFVKLTFYLIGPALKNKENCLNDVDFYSMEPLNNIPYDNFFSYKDEHDFMYGFELSSLINYIKINKKREITNPYNRGSMTHIIPKIKQLKRLHKIINKQEKSEESYRNIQVLTDNNIRNRTLSIGHSFNHSEMLENIRQTRLKTPEERTKQLFLEIDHLGNYTNFQWFMNLDRRSYLRYFRILKDIWTYRAQIPGHIKIKICPLWDPFQVLSSNDLLDLNTEQLKCRCLSVMEDMVYTGIEREYKELGALHVLSVLTVVNGEARENMPWLYESLL